MGREAKQQVWAELEAGKLGGFSAGREAASEARLQAERQGGLRG